MTSSPQQFLAALGRFSTDQVRQAGQRYTPGIDPKAPNLRIASIFTAIENVACGPGAQARFQSFVDELFEAWRRAKYCSQHPDAIHSQIEGLNASVPSTVTRLRSRDVTAAAEWVARLSAIKSAIEADRIHWNSEEAKLPPPKGEEARSTSRNTIQGHLYSIARCIEVLQEEIGYSQSAAFNVLTAPLLLVSGEWGTGKTHLLCDVTQDRHRRGQATVLCLAKNFQGQILNDICTRIEAGSTPESLFDQLQAASNRLGERSIVVVDGVNEGRRKEWCKAIASLRGLVVSRPGIGLIVTCRTPFEDVAIAPDDRKHFHVVQHQGFDDQEFDAQAAFFQYYELPLPEVPLLDREFSRPLALKLICQSLQSLTDDKLAKGFAGIASGQKGMTFVLESFVNRVGQPLEREYGLIAKGCWWLLKGTSRIADKKRAGFAPCMAASLRAYVRPAEADQIIAANYPAFTAARRRDLLEAMRTSGLIEEDVVWYRSSAGVKSRIVYRLPYQRFSDHLIARHLLESNLDVSSAAAIARSFLPDSPMGRIFRISSSHIGRYAEPGWAQALITEFPERVRSHTPVNVRELFFALPRKAQNLSAYFEPFIDGLFWRNPESFTEGTGRLLNQYLASTDNAWKKVIDTLAAISTKHKHPYHAGRLYDYMSRFTMADRDATWSEYLRHKYASPTIRRLLTWAQKLDVAAMAPSTARQLVVLLSLVLTTVVRSDRDVATKALVLIGERYPEILFDHVVKGLSFNDPYVPERLLAAGYGVTMSLIDSATAATFRPLLSRLADQLYQELFAPRAPRATHHCLIRDHALGIIQLALRAQCGCLLRRAGRDLALPYPQVPFVVSNGKEADAAVNEAIGLPIRMDFGNYTIGRLIPDRANYDDNNPDYIRARAQIEQRIYDLGYRKAQFENIDREIGGRNFNERDQVRVDRYGKKYSWIAYFEMWGEYQAKKILPGERTSDCGVDPSFPKRPPTWNPPISDLFGDVACSTERWVTGGFTPNWESILSVPEINGHAGPWVLLEGFVRGANSECDRELFAFLRGLFVAGKDVGLLRKRFLGIEYPGNHQIPDGASEYYLYAGEAGRRDNYARELLLSNGTYRRQLREAFDRYVAVKTSRQLGRRNLKIRFQGKNGKEVISILPSPKYRTRHIPGIRVELPSITFSWESYHSTQNDFSGFALPAPSLIQRLGLASRNREIDFYENSGMPGVLYRGAGGGWEGNQHSLLYIRADLLKKYLARTRQELVWCNWGERDWLEKMDGLEVRSNPARQKALGGHKHIHRSFAHWSG